MKPVPVVFLLFCLATSPPALCAANRGADAASRQILPAPAESPPGVGAQPSANQPGPSVGEPSDSAALPPPSSAAQQLYSAARADLLQIRMLLKNGRIQSSVGSGFMVGNSNLVVTNYHVVSQMALDPDIYTGEYLDTDGNSGPIELLAVDVLHDLAVVRVNREGTGFFKVPERKIKLTQGQYLYSLGQHGPAALCHPGQRQLPGR